MIARKLISACAAVALAASAPVAASAAHPLSVAASSERAGAAMEDGNDLRGRNGTLIAVGVVAAVILLLWLTDTWPFDDDDSESP